MNLLLKDEKDLKITFPPITKKVIVLDIDETLLHASENYDKFIQIKTNINYDLKKYIKILNLRCVDCNYNIWYIERPHVKQFLSFCFSYFRYVCVWSAGEHHYVNRIVRSLFNGLPKPHIILTRNDCVSNEYTYHKPLKKIIKLLNKKFSNKSSAVKLSQVLIVDDRVDNFLDNSDNGILIPKFKPNKSNLRLTLETDSNLHKLMLWFLEKEIMEAEDLSTSNKNMF